MGTPPDESMEIEVDLPPVPQWPWVNYEMEEAPEVYKWLTSKPPRIGLFDDVPEGGTGSRLGRAGDGGNPRHVLWQGGIDSGQG